MFSPVQQAFPGLPDSISALRAVVSQRDVLEVLDQLAAGESTVGELSSTVRRPRRRVRSALRKLMLVGLVCSDHAGSWDHCATTSVPRHASYRHTEAGRVAFRRLSDTSIWDSFFGSDA